MAMLLGGKLSMRNAMRPSSAFSQASLLRTKEQFLAWDSDLLP